MSRQVALRTHQFGTLCTLVFICHVYWMIWTYPSTQQTDEKITAGNHLSLSLSNDDYDMQSFMRLFLYLFMRFLNLLHQQIWSKAPLASLLLLFLSLPRNPQGVTYPSQPWSQPFQRPPTPLSSLISSPLSWDSDFKNRGRLVLVMKIIIYLEALFWDFIDLRQKSWRKGFEGNDPGAGRLEEGRQEMNFLWSFFPRVRIDFCRLEEVRVETNDDSGWGGGIRKLHLEKERRRFKGSCWNGDHDQDEHWEEAPPGRCWWMHYYQKEWLRLFLCLLFVLFLVSPSQ